MNKGKLHSQLFTFYLLPLNYKNVRTIQKRNPLFLHFAHWSYYHWALYRAQQLVPMGL